MSKDTLLSIGFVVLVILALAWTVGYYFFIPCDVLDNLPSKDVPGRCFR